MTTRCSCSRPHHDDQTVVGGPAPGPAAPGTTAWALALCCGRLPHPAPVRLVTRDLADAEVEALHARGDCYVSLCRSEGWGIPPFDAAARGTPVVITGFGGHLAYLDADSAYLVDYDLVPVDDPFGGRRTRPTSAGHSRPWSTGRRSCDASWPSRTTAAARAEAARRRVLRDFDPAVVAASFLAALRRFDPR